MYDKLDAKVNNIDIGGFVLKTKWDTYKSGLKKKTSGADKRAHDTRGFVKKADYNAKLIEIETKIPSISGSATTSASTSVENKIPNISNLVKKQIMMQNC